MHILYAYKYEEKKKTRIITKRVYAYTSLLIIKKTLILLEIKLFF